MILMMSKIPNSTIPYRMYEPVIGHPAKGNFKSLLDQFSANDLPGAIGSLDCTRLCYLNYQKYKSISSINPVLSHPSSPFFPHSPLSLLTPQPSHLTPHPSHLSFNPPTAHPSHPSTLSSLIILHPSPSTAVRFRCL